MATEISAVGMAVQTAGPAVSSAATRLSQAEVVPGSAPVHAASVSGPRGNAYGYHVKIEGEHARTQSAQDQRLDQAVGVRQARQAFADAEKILGAAEDALGAIVKRYPPYAPNSPERIELLNQVTGLKKQIEALNFPPEAAEKPEELDPILKELLGLAEETQSEIPDEALAVLLEKVEAAKAIVAEQRDEMWSDLFSPDTKQLDQEVAARAGVSKALLAGINQPLSQSPDVLTDLA